MNFVLDASVTLTRLLADGKRSTQAYARKVQDAASRNNVRAVVPMTWGLEVSNVLSRAEAKALLTEAQSEAFLELLDNLDIEVDSATFAKSLSDTLQLSRRHGLSSYDASYLEVALREGLPLATLDEELRRIARRTGVKAFGV